MNRFCMCAIMSVLLVVARISAPAYGQEAVIRSGEHSDFSRLVLEFSVPPDWRLTRQGNGYLLTTPQGLRLSGLDRVFRFIPRSRISDVTIGPDGGLTIKTRQGMAARAFVLRNSALVIDVARVAEDQSIDALVDGPVQLLSGAGMREEAVPDRPAALELFPYRSDPAPLVLPPLSLADHPDGHRADFVTDLAEAIARAAAQGLVDAADPISSGATDTSDTGAGVDGALASQPNVRLQTAIDKALGTKPDTDTVPPPVPTCLPATRFDVSTWMTDDPPAAQIASARAALLEEFDRSDPEKASRLAKLYIALGFGSEAELVLTEFTQPTPEIEQLIELARLVDDPTGMPVSFSDQIVCDSPASFWAALAADAIPRDESFARAAALRTFSGLPRHLRQHLGPRLAMQLHAARDDDGVAHVEAAVMLAAGPGSEALLLIRALGAHSGAKSPGDLTPDLTALAQSMRPEATGTLLTLIENSMMQGQPVPHDLIETAEILGFEQKGTKQGADLRAAGIRARAHNGDAPGAVDELILALEDGTLPPDAAQPVMAALLNSTAERATGDAVLRIVFDPRLGSLLSTAERRLRRDLAERMISLGFAREAARIAPALPSAPAVNEAIYAARLARALGEFDRAQTLALALDDRELTVALAESLSQAGQHDVAAELYRTAQESEAADLESWRAGDWGMVEAADDLVLANAARRMLQQEDVSGMGSPPSIAGVQLLLGESAGLRADLTSLFAAMPRPVEGEGM